ncbi:Lipopolysaccharide export system permease protein LptF [Tepidimonas alkaliphilus]|uniref:Lipopolysaccharide export system permease protein LptF n=1 Tax=Tepidimonas alkaliphilus TaxID=2588942 RepID=A0A554WD48_9BURK|nr:LPS export ABC transporter permease LptF [Tepidimonas alkaliphilus]TSE21508.1 Lipopolysaccharide export system permease protein LptF [Tepidimonas alkaliphilus]
MLFESSLRRELARAFGAALVVILTVVLTMALVRTLRQASRGEVDPQALLLFLTYALIGQLGVVLTVALLVAVVATLARLQRDHEWIIWRTCGISLTRLARPVVRVAWPIWLAVGALALLAAPWAQQQRDELRQRYEQRGDLQRVTPGQFQESADGRRVLFIDRNAEADRSGRHIFVSGTQPDGSLTVITARAGELHRDERGTWLTLHEGQRWQRSADGQQRELAQFERHMLRLADAAPPELELRRRSATPTWRLLSRGDAADQAELAWRVGLALSAINLTLLGLTATAAQPRMGRAGHLMFMLLAFVVYYNLLGATQGWASRGLGDPWMLALALHGGVAALTLGWIAWRDHGGLRRLPRGALAC